MRAFLLFALTIFISFLAADARAACTSPASPAGGLNWVSGSTKFQFCDGSAWQDFGGLWSDSGSGYIEYTSTLGGLKVGSAVSLPAPDGAVGSSGGGGGGTPAGADREIQFNSGGAFGSSPNFKLMSDGDFLVIGNHTATASAPVSGAGSRMFFDRQMSAFRAGAVDGTQWDTANIGEWSIALGNKTKASGKYSTAFGDATTASSQGATAFGSWTTASNWYAIAGGIVTTASGYASIALGNETQATGDYSLAFGLGDSTGTNPIVSGQSSIGFFLGDQNGVDVSQANAMVLMGGNFGIGDTTPDVALDVVGDINYTGQIVDVSDIRLKENVRPIGSPLKKLTSLNGFAFEMKDDPKHVTEYGVSAQDVREVFPELVHEVDDNGTLGVNYSGLIAPMLEAIKEQQAQIDALQAEIELLRAERDNRTGEQ
jgi:hypothetical protein